ncbi:MAG: hypothetical protein IJ111_07495 [Eggerthellaceae bacterium]|nr:hypothetical protein [Eggerthellaceae bacterium]
MGKKLTVWQAACIITGYSVGSGIMALPYLMSNAGLLPGIVIIVLAFVFSYIMHLLLAELAMGARGNEQIVSIFAHYMVKGTVGKVVAAVSMVVVVLALFFAQAGFISGGADVLMSAGMPEIAAILVFYVVAAAVVFFGLKVMGVSESVSVTVIIAVVLVLAVGSFGHFTNALDIPVGSFTDILAFYGMTMFAFVAFFSIPQAVVGLDYDPVRVRRAVLLGLGVNLVFIVVIVGCSLAASAEVTELAMLGWSAGIGPWAQVLGGVFTLLAMLTTYWSNSLACSDMIREQFKLNDRLCWLLATLPSLVLVLAAGSGFLSMMRLSSGLVAILIAIGLPIVVVRAKRMNGRLYLVRPWMASTPVLVVLVAAFVFMAVGSMI